MTRKNQDPETPKSRGERLTLLLDTIEERLEKGEGKISIADFVRLMQFERELKEEQPPREMKVTWSEPLETYDIDE